MTQDKVKKTIETYERTAEWYADKHSDDMHLIQEQIDFFIKNLKGKRILDIGCGPGRDAKYFSEQGFEVTGIDLTKNFIRIASERVPKAKFILMDMRKLEFQDNYFDGIWISGSFQHLQKNEAKEALMGFKRVLKPGGLIYVSGKEGTGEREVKKEHYQGGSKFFSFYKEDELRDLFDSCSFEIFDILVKKNKDIWINLFAVNL